MSNLNLSSIAPSAALPSSSGDVSSPSSPSSRSKSFTSYSSFTSFSPPPRSASSSQRRTAIDPPLCNFVDAMLVESTNLLTAYAHWRNGHHLDPSVFDLFFRVHPFGGEFTIWAGLEEVLRFLSHWSLSVQDIEVLRRKFPEWNVAFFDWLRATDLSGLKVYAIAEGTVVFPRLPLIRVEGPLALCQLLESAFLVLTSYPSLVATNAARHRVAVGQGKQLLEFGLRRAQGSDGAMSASRYAYMGGFDGTSNVKAACVFDIPMKGTHAHSFVVSFNSLDDVKVKTLLDISARGVVGSPSGTKRDFVAAVLTYRSELKRTMTHEGELAAFIAYAQAFPNNFLGLLDTYDTLESGVWNYLLVALALHEFGYRPLGVRLDSGDLAYLSVGVRSAFVRIGEQYKIDYFAKMTIVASNDLSEKVLYALKEQGHEIDTFGVGTNLVTCKTQPALGMEYRLVSVNDQPRMKVSSDHEKISIPGSKDAYRLYNSAAEPVLDLLVSVGTAPPLPHKRLLCRHHIDPSKRVYVTPHRVEPLLKCVWDGAAMIDGCKDSAGSMDAYPSITKVRDSVNEQLAIFRTDHLRRLNPTCDDGGGGERSTMNATTVTSPMIVSNDHLLLAAISGPSLSIPLPLPHPFSAPARAASFVDPSSLVLAVPTASVAMSVSLAQASIAAEELRSDGRAIRDIIAHGVATIGRERQVGIPAPSTTREEE